MGSYNEVEVETDKCSEIDKKTDSYDKMEEDGQLLDGLSIELLQKIPFLTLAQLNNTFPDQVCWTFEDLIATTAY